MPDDSVNKNVLNFKSAGMKRAGNRDATVSKGKQFGIGNFISWAIQKYPQLTLGQLEQKMPSLEREYAQEKAMRKNEPDIVPSVAPQDPSVAPQSAKALGKIARDTLLPQAQENKDLNRLKKLAGITEDSVEKDIIGHVDAEADMIRKELFKMGKYSVELYRMLDKVPNGDFPHWWQAKLVKAGEYVADAKHYLEAELYAPEEESPLDTDETRELQDINPSGV